MLQFLTDYAVPACLFLLMLVAGSESRASDFALLRYRPRAVLLGTLGQLLLLPLLALAIISAFKPLYVVASGVLFLSVCPGGGISNYYCYLGRCNVMLSATITAIGTLLSLITIPIWLAVLPAMSFVSDESPLLPSASVIKQLLVMMVLPLGIGMLFRHYLPYWVQRSTGFLRIFSLCTVLLVLGLGIWTLFDKLTMLYADIIGSATLFVLGAMLLGWLTGHGLNECDRPVLVIESGVRNIAVALILGTALLSPDDFATLASFLTAYFIIEIIVMLTYARLLASRLDQRCECAGL